MCSFVSVDFVSLLQFSIPLFADNWKQVSTITYQRPDITVITVITTLLTSMVTMFEPIFLHTNSNEGKDGDYHCYCITVTFNDAMCTMKISAEYASFW